jgi:hypothetical protein
LADLALLSCVTVLDAKELSVMFGVEIYCAKQVATLCQLYEHMYKKIDVNFSGTKICYLGVNSNGAKLRVYILK